jgi:putative transposase
MKRKRFSVEQIVAIVKQAEMGLPVAELIRRVGIREQTCYRWKNITAGWRAIRSASSSSSRTRMAD